MDLLKKILYVIAKSKCDTEREEVAGKNYRATKAGTKQAPQFVPQCNRDGSYEKIQIDVTAGSAFCVDEQGKEINGDTEIITSWTD